MPSSKFPKETGNMMHVPLTRPFFDNREEKAVCRVLQSGWHTQGPAVAQLEQQVASLVHAKYAIAVSNCSIALYLSLLIAQVGKGDEVLVPSFTFIACACAISETGATPVFVEVNEQTFNIDPDDLEKKITSKTKAILAVDQVGLPCDLDKIRKIAKRNKLFLVEDAACAFGSYYKKEPIGGLSETTCFSFHARKIISSGEGGMITTQNGEIAEKARMLRSYGATIADHTRHTSKKIMTESYEMVSLNYRLTDIQAAILIEQMKKLPTILKKRSLLARRYNKKLFHIRSIRTPFIPDNVTPNWQSYIITLLPDAPLSQEEIMQHLLNHRIATRRGVMACHIEPVYKKQMPGVSLPVTEMLAARTITLPLFPDMTIEQQDYVIKHLTQLLTI